MTETSQSTSDRIFALLGQAKKIAKEYRDVSGRPLGITGEVAEYEAARILGLELSGVRQAGYDAVRYVDGMKERIQIKGRCLLDEAKPGQRLGGIRLDKEWEVVLMVIMDSDFEALEIYEAGRGAITQALMEPGSKARNERGALAVSKFKSIGKRIWRREGLSVDAVQQSQKTSASERPARRGQNASTGAAGNAFGYETAPRIAEAIGATMVGPNSNEATWRGKQIVIKSARAGTSSIGVTYTMLERIELVIAAFQRADTAFDLYEISAADYKALMKPSRSTPEAGRKVGIVTAGAIRELTRAFRTVLLKD